MRHSIDEYEILPLDIDDGTSVQSCVINKLTHERGYLKTNGCMLDINGEDINEYLACKILYDLGYDAPKIELVDDKGKNSWVSYNLLKENETTMTLESPNVDDTITDNEEWFKNYMQSLYETTLVLNDSSKKIYQSLLEIIFMDCMLDNYDFKVNNYKIAMSSNIADRVLLYDYGVAFNPNAIQKNGIFRKLSKDEVMCYMLKYFKEELSDLINKINKIITPEYLNGILVDENLRDVNKESYCSNIIYNIEKLSVLMKINVQSLN